MAIGQKNANVARTIKTLEESGAMEYVMTIVSAPAADNPANQYLAPYAGCAMGEWYMENGMDALIVYDDLSKHAVAYRQISLILNVHQAVKLIQEMFSIFILGCLKGLPALMKIVEMDPSLHYQ